MNVPVPFAIEDGVMTLHCRVVGVRSADAFNDALQRVTIQIREGGMMGREIELPNKWGLILDDEFLLEMKPKPPAEDPPY